MGNGPCHAFQALGFLELPFLVFELESLRLCLLALGDVAQNHTIHRRMTGILHDGRLQMNPKYRSIIRHHPQIAFLQFTLLL